MKIKTIEENEIRQQVLLFEKARNNLLAVIAFTVINTILTVFDAEINFLFSATLPQFIFGLSRTLDSEMGSNIFTIIGIVCAFIIIITYFIFWILSKRIRILILAALIFFCLDSLVLLMLILTIDFEFSILLEIAFHCWILYYLVVGTKAWNKMLGVSTEEYIAILKKIKSEKTIPIDKIGK